MRDDYTLNSRCLIHFCLNGWKNEPESERVKQLSIQSMGLLVMENFTEPEWASSVLDKLCFLICFWVSISCRWLWLRRLAAQPWRTWLRRASWICTSWKTGPSSLPPTLPWRSCVWTRWVPGRKPGRFPRRNVDRGVSLGKFEKRNPMSYPNTGSLFSDGSLFVAAVRSLAMAQAKEPFLQTPASLHLGEVDGSFQFCIDRLADMLQKQKETKNILLRAQLSIKCISNL